jgi:DNA polymerase-3 subunit delta'
MSLDSIIGQPFAADLCRQWLKRQTTHPLLFYGPEGVGKKTLALEVAKALNCASPGLRPPSPGGRGAGGEACDICLSCRKIAAGNHPDVRVIDLAWQALERKEPLEKQQNLRMETVMTERHRLLQRPTEGAWKVAILDDAHRLTPDAANVLLKILEEPPANTAIFLVTPFRDRLFATLVSRCQPVRFRALSDEEMMQCLKRLGSDPLLNVGSDPISLARLTEMALGSPGRALHLNREEQIEAVREAEQLWQSLGTMTPSRLLHEAGGRSKSFKPNRADIERQIHSLLVPAARALRAGDMRAQKPVRHIQSALTQLRQNVQPALVYDYLLLRLSKEKK